MAESTSGTPAATADDRPLRTRFGPERVALVAVAIALVGTLPAAVSWRPLAWLPLLPLLGAVWVLRAGVRVDADGVVVCNGLARRRVPWERVEGFDVPRRGPVRLVHDGRRTPLAALPRRDLRELLRAAERLAGPVRA